MYVLAAWPHNIVLGIVSERQCGNKGIVHN